MTTITNVKGWSGMELVVGMEVQVDPAAKGDEHEVGTAFDFTGRQELVRIYANGDDVQVKDWQGKKIRATRLQVRPKMITEEREAVRNKKMEDCHIFAKRQLRKQLDSVKTGHLNLIEKMSECKSAADAAYVVKNYAEDALVTDARMQSLVNYGFVDAVEHYESGEATLEKTAAAFAAGRENAVKDALKRPYKHNSTSVMDNLQQEIGARVRCELGDPTGYNTWFRAGEVEWFVRELKRLAEEW